LAEMDAMRKGRGSQHRARGNYQEEETSQVATCPCS
jgi:hypothetical protein